MSPSCSQGCVGSASQLLTCSVSMHSLGMLGSWAKCSPVHEWSYDPKLSGCATSVGPSIQQLYGSVTPAAVCAATLANQSTRKGHVIDAWSTSAAITPFEPQKQ